MNRVLHILCCLVLALLFIILSGCTKEYWLADPNYERLLLAYPPLNMHINTEPAGARVVITSLRNVQVYAGYAPINIQYRPNPHVPSWLLIGKKGYRSTAIRIDYEEETEVNMFIVLAMLHEDEQSQLDISGPYSSQPMRSSGGMSGPANAERMLRQMMGGEQQMRGGGGGHH